MTRRIPFGSKSSGTTKLIVGWSPAPESVTLTGNGRGVWGGRSRGGVVSTLLSDPFWNVSVHAPRKLWSNAMLNAQKLASTARPTHRDGPSLLAPCEAVIVVPAAPLGT